MTDLQQIAQSTPTAQLVFTALSQRLRHRSEPMSLARFKRIIRKQGARIIEDDYYTVFEELSKQGFGSIVRGRGRRPIRFIWNKKLTDIADSAKIDRTKSLSELSKSLSVSRTESNVIKETQLRTLIVFVMHGKSIKIECSDELTKEEKLEVSNFFTTL